ncbi:MAG: hypothetical protein DWQ02_11800 [Bacteroidetes bacterium]|nr:MAG: hypothetical protein DWQ02_11800 [Bacteroidota bacterium]
MGSIISRFEILYFKNTINRIKILIKRKNVKFKIKIIIFARRKFQNDVNKLLEQPTIYTSFMALN